MTGLCQNLKYCWIIPGVHTNGAVHPTVWAFSVCWTSNLGVLSSISALSRSQIYESRYSETLKCKNIFLTVCSSLKLPSNHPRSINSWGSLMSIDRVRILTVYENIWPMFSEDSEICLHPLCSSQEILLGSRKWLSVGLNSILCCHFCVCVSFYVSSQII